MKIIANRGFDKLLTRIIVLRNAEETTVGYFKNDCCELDAKDGDHIVVKLRYLDTSAVTIASFVYHTGNDVYYVCPTRMCRIWELLNYCILPYTCLLLLALEVAVECEAYAWFCVAMTVLMLVSLLGLKISMLIPSMRKRLMRTEIL